MPERIPLYRRTAQPVLPREAFYDYGAGPEYAFFNRVPVPLADSPEYEDFNGGSEVVFEEPGSEVDVPGIGQSLVAAGLPTAGGYVGQKVGRFVGEGQPFSEAVGSSFSEVGDDISGLFGGGSQNAGNIASNSAVSAPVTTSAPNAELDIGIGSGVAGDSVAGGFSDNLFSSSNLGGAAGVGLGSALGSLIMGQSPKKALLGGAGSAAGFAVGNAILPGIGGFLGGSLGGALGGRVICTYLHAIGLMDIELLRCELFHTGRHMSKTTVRGYHFWAIPYVRLMRRRKWAVRFMRPIATARAKEIAHVLGHRDRPHWGGRLVRILTEPVCWVIGAAIEAIEAHQTKEATCSRT